LWYTHLLSFFGVLFNQHDKQCCLLFGV
jgi:hypothetical protein